MFSRNNLCIAVYGFTNVSTCCISKFKQKVLPSNVKTKTSIMIKKELIFQRVFAQSWITIKKFSLIVKELEIVSFKYI